jgi:hypothetical protein
MRYEIQYRSRRYKDRHYQPWDNPWQSYGENTISLSFIKDLVVGSDDLEVLKTTLKIMHENSSGMVDHRIIQIIDDESAVFDPC